ncbi:MAG: tRNA uridine-5-carboxymethylaminomethyl(34) synthesis GTPase MnmE [Bacteroidales bacterium]|nr:tRNA uridine-5-carboxymethylaminomethyl(34) synthesis GTPase MnmE [Candidatus Cryptobacteroides choladohippi]
MSDTICAPATASNGGAIAVIRISGPQSLQAVDSIAVLRSGKAVDAPGYSLRFGEIPGVDEVLVSIFRAPHSYTGEDSAELSCHCSPYIVRKILELLLNAGCRMAEPGEFTRRAFLAGKMDLAQAEAVSELISSDSAAAHRIALNQLRGGYSAELKTLRDSILDLTALVELELDFSEEEVEFAGRDRLRTLLGQAISHVDSLSESFRVGNAIKNGVPVVIAGAVNSGKSTLLNALVGENRAIVSDIPGTTRDTVEEVVTVDGVQFRFIDTAGIRETSDTVERIGIDRAHSAIAAAEIVIGVIDGSAAKAGDCASAGADALAPGRICSGNAGIISAVDAVRAVVPAGKKLILVRTKIDLCPDAEPVEGVLDICAANGQGLNELKAELSSYASSVSEGTVVTSARHYEALRDASSSLGAVLAGMDAGIPTDLLAEDLREAVRALGRIWGEDLGISAQDTLNHIFSRFCIGK